MTMRHTLVNAVTRKKSNWLSVITCTFVASIFVLISLFAYTQVTTNRIVAM